MHLTAPSNARGMGSIPGWGTKIPPDTQCSKKKIIGVFSFNVTDRPMKQKRKSQIYMGIS